jgi:hypothetical protein
MDIEVPPGALSQALHSSSIPLVLPRYKSTDISVTHRQRSLQTDQATNREVAQVAGTHCSMLSCIYALLSRCGPRDSEGKLDNDRFTRHISDKTLWENKVRLDLWVELAVQDFREAVNDI